MIRVEGPETVAAEAKSFTPVLSLSKEGSI